MKKTATTILILGIALAFGGVTQGSITIDPAGPVTIGVGQTVNLQATYAPSQDVTHYEWLIDGQVVAGTQKKIDQDDDPATTNSGGTTSFVFDATGLEPGEYTVCFHIWHQTQGRHAYGCVTVNVVADEECPAAPAIANAYLDFIGFTGGRGDIISAVASQMGQGATFQGIDKCDPAYEDAVIAFVDAYLEVYYPDFEY